MDVAPPRLATARLVLRRPVIEDAPAIFAYASDPEATRYIGFVRHQREDDARAFVAFSHREWERGAGPYLIEQGGIVLGSTGLHVETPYRAFTGYILAPHAWGHGYATEAVTAIVALARRLGYARLGATVHPANAASIRVLDKTGFVREGLMRRHTVLPNLSDEPQDVWQYASVFD